MVDASLISAAAALGGAATGGLMSLLASLLANHKQARAQWLAQDRSGRETLYKEFIEAASTCYVDALQHDKPDIPMLVTLYAKTNRMRVISSPQVIASAELVVRRIVDTYFEPDRTFTQVRSMVADGSLDIIRNFSEKTRAEFDYLRAQQF
jgi:hypothetical protein